MNRKSTTEQSNLARSNTGVSSQMRDRNVTMSRTGTMPNLNVQNQQTAATLAGRNGTRSPVEMSKSMKLRMAYDSYLSGVEALYLQNTNARKMASNFKPQKIVFAERMRSLKQELLALNETLTAKKALKTEKEQLIDKIEILKMLCTSITLDHKDMEAATLLKNTASKVVVKNFKEMDADEMIAANKLLDEICENLKSFDCQEKIEVRYKLKKLLIQVAVLITKLNEHKSKCAELYKEHESLQNQNKSLKILKSQFEENPDASLLSKKCDLVETFDEVLDDLFDESKS